MQQPRRKFIHESLIMAGSGSLILLGVSAYISLGYTEGFTIWSLAGLMGVVGCGMISIGLLTAAIVAAYGWIESRMKPSFLIAAAKKNHPGPFFMGTPDEWYEPAHFWCDNGHRSARYLKTESGNRCLVCRESVFLGPATLPGYGEGT